MIHASFRVSHGFLVLSSCESNMVQTIYLGALSLLFTGNILALDKEVYDT